MNFWPFLSTDKIIVLLEDTYGPTVLLPVVQAVNISALGERDWRKSHPRGCSEQKANVFAAMLGTWKLAQNDSLTPKALFSSQPM